MCTPPTLAPPANLISALLLCVIIVKLCVLILLFLIYTNCVIGSNEANYITAQVLTQTYFKGFRA